MVICSYGGEYMNKTVTRNFRIPEDVYNRIVILANKRKWSINAWVVNTISRESKPKNDRCTEND